MLKITLRKKNKVHIYKKSKIVDVMERIAKLKW